MMKAIANSLWNQSELHAMTVHADYNADDDDDDGDGGDDDDDDGDDGGDDDDDDDDDDQVNSNLNTGNHFRCLVQKTQVEEHHKYSVT